MTDITAPQQHPVPYVQRVAQIICAGLYPEANATGKRLADFPKATRDSLLTIAEAIRMAEREHLVVLAPDCVPRLRAELQSALARQPSADFQLPGELILPSASSAALTDEPYEEIKATLQGAHAIMESLSAIERRVGPVGSHARGYTHKITNALKHLDALWASAQRLSASPAAPQPSTKALTEIVEANRYCLDWCADHVKAAGHDSMAEGLRAILAVAAEQPSEDKRDAEVWTRMGEGLPERPGPCLVMFTEDNELELTTEYPMQASYREVTGKGFTYFDSWRGENISIDDQITHWMPLPPPPALADFGDAAGQEPKA